MQKRLSAFGNSLGVVIEKPILQLLKIDRETRLEMTTDGDRIVLTPVRTDLTVDAPANDTHPPAPVSELS